MSDRYWGKPLKARTWHVFEDGRSLCGNWALFNSTGTKEDVTADDTYSDEEDCKACARESDVLEVEQ